MLRRRRRKKMGGQKTAPQARKKESGNAIVSYLSELPRARLSVRSLGEGGERAPVRLWRISRRDFLQNKFGFCPKHTADCGTAGQKPRFVLYLRRFCPVRALKNQLHILLKNFPNNLLKNSSVKSGLDNFLFYNLNLLIS